MQDSRTRVQEGDLEVGIEDSEEMQAVHRAGGCTVTIQSLFCDMRLLTTAPHPDSKGHGPSHQ